MAWAPRFQFLAVVTNVSLLNSYGTQPAFYLVDTGAFSPELNFPGSEANRPT
jgi:hypothetical protein